MRECMEQLSMPTITYKSLRILLLIIFSFQMSSVASAKEVLVWTSNEGAAKAINAIKAEYEKDYKVNVKVEVLNKDLTSLFKTASLTGKGPDILIWANDVSGELAQSGLIEPLDELPFLIENFLPVSLKAFRYKGRLYGYPYAFESLVLFSNPKLAPTELKSFEAIEEFSIALKKKSNGSYGFLFDFKTFFFSFPLLNASGGYIFGENENGLDASDVGVNHPGFIDGMNFLARLKKSELIPSSIDRGIAFEKFKAGNLAYMIDGPWAIKDLEAAKVPYRISILPTLNQKPAKPFVGVHGFMIRRSSENKLLAKELIEKYFLSPKGMKIFYQFDNRAPTHMEVLSELSKSDSKLDIYKKSAEVGVAMPNVPQMGSVWGAMGKALSLVLEQNKSSRDTLEQARAEIK